MGFLERHIRTRPNLLAFAYRLRRWAGPLVQHPLRAWLGYRRFFRDRNRYLRMGGSAPLKHAYPCLFDRTAETRIDPQYFYQAVWAFRKIIADRVPEHVDIGSDTKFVGMLSAACRVIFVDIRPLAVSVDNLECRSGTLLALPFADGSVRSLSSLHVIEHIGLGRYGDPLDPQGSRKACAELARVLAPGGRLYLSTPIGRPREQFNGQRVFSLEEITGYFVGLRLANLALIDPLGRFHADIAMAEATRLIASPGGLDYSLGCFAFERPDA